ncbi:glycoside hydrolase [Mucor ambiguus]|uniref:Glycoside hydrolase n=1 Tax=Mucor ambiguus TaxID=91626 RepID=A0A0C9N9C0_9FUNG|nr:glycoside hydrolase [Mucor ambiguus]
MYISNLSLCAVALFGAVASAATLNKCTSGTTNFSKGLGGWTEERNLTSGWKITDQGLVMTLEAPKQIVRMTNSSDSNNPYNKYASPTSTNFIYSTLLHYGSVSFNLETAGKAGAVTAAVFMAPGGDEIDFEMLGAEHNKVQTNFFYGANPIYNVNSADTEVGINTASGIHNYTVDWSPERIEFFVDRKLIRTVVNKDNCNKEGDCTYPTHAATIQIGLWDSSAVSGTTQWARGPIDWVKGETINATVKSVTVNCNPKYNAVN